MKKQFQSKSVPRGTRTIWRYLGALFILFTFAIGQMWGVTATPTPAGIYAIGNNKAGGQYRFVPMLSGSVYNYRMNNSSYGDAGMKLKGNENAVIVYLGSSMDLTVTCTLNKDNKGEDAAFTVYTIAKTSFDEIISKENQYSSDGSSRTVEISTTGTQASFTVEIPNNVGKGTFTGSPASALPAGYYYIVGSTPSDGNGNVYFTSITLAAGSGGGGGDTPTPDPSEAPTINTQPSTTDVQYLKDATGATALSVEAEGNGTLSYQWYKNTSKSNAGGTALENCTTATYTPSTAAEGKLYYYCAVTNTESGKSATTVKSNVSGMVRVVPAPTHLVENVMATSGNWDSYIVSTNTHISNLKTITASDGKTLIKSGKESASSSRTPGITSNSSSSLVEGDHIYVQFTIEDGYELTVSDASVQVFSISNPGKYVARISDNASTPNVIATTETTVAKSDDADLFEGYDFSDSPKLSGTVTLKLFAYGWSDGYRMKSPLYIDGTVTAKKVVKTTDYALTDVKVNGTSISAANLATLKTASAYKVDLADQFAAAPTIKFNKETTITYTDDSQKVTDEEISVDATIVDGKWQAQAEIGGITYTVTAVKVTSFTVNYFDEDGTTSLGSEVVSVTGHPNASEITVPTKSFKTFADWKLSGTVVDLNNVSAGAGESVDLVASYTPAYATSINIEQWVLDNSKNNTAFRAVLDARHYEYANLNDVDSLRADKNDGDRNEPYLGQKWKLATSEISFLLKSGSTVRVKFGNVGSDVNIKLGDNDPFAKTAAQLESPYEYTATEDVIVRLQGTGTGTVVVKQIMIDEAIAAVKLHAVVTYDAGAGTFGKANEKYTGTPLVIADATPAEDYTFAGWFLGEDQINAAAYEPTKNVTLVAHYAPQEFAIAYDGNGATSGSMSVGAAGWGTMVTPDANAFEKTGHVFSGWEITKTSDGSATGITFSEGKFEMPKYDVTLVAQWEDNSKVAVIVETNVKYNDLAVAIEAAEPGQTVQLIQDINQEEAILIDKNLTLDLNNKTFTVTNPSSEYSNRAIKVTAGTIVIENGTVDALSNETHNSGCWGSLRQEGGHLTCNNVTFKNYRSGGLGLKPVGGTLILNECTVLSEFGGGLELGNATVEVNNCTFTQTGTDAQKIYGACFGMGKMGTLTINGGTYTSDNYAFYIYTSGGTINVNSGTFAGDIKTEMNNTQYPSAVGTINISGGTFDGVGENPIVFTAVTANDHISISGGVFDAPIENQYCAEGYVPQDNGDGSYGVKPKDGVCLIKGNVGDNTFVIDEDASLLNGTPSKNNVKSKSSTYQTLTGWKFNSRPAHLGLTLSEGTFQKGDVVEVFVTSVADDQGANDKMRVFSANDVTKMLVEGDADMVQGANRLTLPETTTNALYLVRGSENADYDMWNPYVAYFAVYRAMNPVLTAITINGRAGVIDPENDKHFTVTIPNDANLASLTVVPTIVRNAAHATTPEAVISNEGAWVLTADGDNTYRIMDKDGDYTDYTITLSRDVLKHAVKFYDGETLLETVEVEDETQMAAGDVPADPTKEDYLFQGWAETDGGAVVDVTSFTISATKNFYAKWAADGAIKLINKTSGAVNEDGYFITGVTATEANSEKAAAWGGTQGATISGTNQLNKVVQYNATTNQTKLQIKVYNTNNSDKYVYIHKIIEGKTTEESVETLTATSKTVVESEFYEFNDTKNRSFYLTTNSADVKILQVKVIESGETPMKQAGEAGYSLNLNKGRVVYYANSDVTLEGLALQSASNYSVISSSEFQTTKNISFSISTPILLKVTTNSAKYYVSQDPDEDGTTATAVTDAGTAEFNLTTTGTWYLVPSTTSNVKYTNIAFELPKAATPVIETQPATNHTFNPGDMTATVVATVSEGTLHYQWYKKATVGDDEEVGTDAATLTTTTEGTYYVVVTNVLAGHQDVSVTSEEAELGYRVTDDATLKSLKYGTTAIALEDGVYDYNVELAKGTTDVPALAATATMNGYATVTISNAAEFVSYAATSTVTVKSEDLTVTNVYTVNFTVKHDLPQVDVTGSTVWDMTNVSASAIELSGSDKNARLLLANIDGVNNTTFNAQALMFEGQHIGRTGAGIKHLAGRYVQFNVTVPGAVFVTFESNGDNARTISINGKKCSRITSGTAANDYITYALAVEPGSVEIIGYEGESANQYVRISKIEFKAEYSHRRAVNPSYLGTLCWKNNAILGGATLYKLAGKNENNYLVFDEVEENRLEAGKPYIFMPENGSTEIRVYNTDNEDALEADQEPVNHMYGTITGKTLVPGQDDEMYYFSASHIWAVKDFVVNIDVPAYFCYVDYEAVLNDNPAPAPAHGRRRVTMGVQGQQVATGIEDVQGDKVQCTKMLINGQLFILRGEKMYDAKGQLVK